MTRVTEYKAYLQNCLDDNDFDITTVEDFHEWVETEYCQCNTCKEIRENNQ